jgi:hypothetical protein
LSVRESAGIARTNEIIRSGVPLPRALNITTTSGIAVVNGGGQLVPAQFRILARWNAGLSTTSAPIQWLLVTFPATVNANSTATYTLVLDGTAGANPAPAMSLSVSQNGNQFTIDTGAARFVIGGGSGSLFDEIRQAGGGAQIVTGSTMTGQANNTSFGHSTTRRAVLEQSGPLSAAIVIEGTYDMAPVGNGALSSRRRYVFSAGSPVAIVRQSVAWEGDLCGAGNIVCNNAPNAVRVQQIRNALSLNVASPLSATAVGAFNTTTTGTIAAGQSASVRQLLRQTRNSSLAFTVNVPNVSTVNGIKADGGMLAVSGSGGAVAIALNQMNRYEPQALRVLSDGRLAIDMVDTADFSGGSAWLGERQGLFATFAVSAFPSAPSRSTLDQQVWAPLNKPLHAWPQPEWFAASDAVEEFPVGALAADFSGFDTKATTVDSTTMTQIDQLGIAGLMTFGVYPRNWANPLYSDEIDCGGADAVTPSESWDDPYWCATWTDYHNTVATIPYFAMRNGRTDWLDDLATPGALRTLHTQIFQCGPNDNYFYCGQAPAGYGGYRVDFNSSHAYFDNLMLYYWLTGDYSVVEMLERGATPMRNYYCDRRPAQACIATDLPTDDFANVNGRVFVQWHNVFRFVGLASGDVSFLDDYAANIGREYTAYYAQVVQNNVTYGFLIDGTLQNSITGAGTYSTDQLWMLSMYDMNLLYRLMRDTNDAPIGSPSVVPSQILAAWARTLNQFGSRVAMGGDGTAAGTWPNALFFTFTGNRIGGALTSVTANEGGGDPDLYDTGKAALTAVVARAADFTGESGLASLELDLARYAWNASLNDPTPLGKQEAEYLIRLPSAIARISQGGSISTPAGIVATATSATTVSVTWNSVPSATSYQVYRRAAGGNYTLVGNPGGTSITDPASANSAYLYRVRALNASGSSTDSASDLATTVVFSDDPLNAGTIIKAVHFAQLRTAANAVQSLAGQTLSIFTDPTLNTTVRVKRLHLLELRSALDLARSALGVGVLSHADPNITAGTTVIKAAHITELRNAVK